MKRTALFLVMFGCSSLPKAPPVDDPLVDDENADSLRAPTMRGTLSPSGLAQDDLDAAHVYHGFTLTLAAGQSIVVRAGGVAQDGSALDTVAYLYGPKDSAGRRGAYLKRNDDRTSSDSGSQLSTV